MATFNFFQVFSTDLSNGVHDGCLTADTDTLKVYLSNTAPSASTHTIKANIAEIAFGTDYTAPIDVQNVKAAATGVITVSGTTIAITASTPDVATFRYVILYNDTPAGPVDPLIGWWDYLSPIDLAAGQPFNITFAPEIFSVGI